MACMRACLYQHVYLFHFCVGTNTSVYMIAHLKHLDLYKSRKTIEDKQKCSASKVISIHDALFGAILCDM